MAICKKAGCPLSHQHHDGKVLVDLVRVLRANNDEGRAPDATTIKRLKQLAPRFYQPGPFCVGWREKMAMLPGAGEAPEVNDLLRNIELLQMHGAFS